MTFQEAPRCKIVASALSFPYEAPRPRAQGQTEVTAGTAVPQPRKNLRA